MNKGVNKGVNRGVKKAPILGLSLILAAAIAGCADDDEATTTAQDASEDGAAGMAADDQDKGADEETADKKDKDGSDKDKSDKDEADSQSAEGDEDTEADTDDEPTEPEIAGACGTDQAALFAVTANDYETTSVSLLAADGSILCQDFINSGSAPTGLSTALSGDVVLPTPGRTPSSVLTLIDRYTTDVITRVDTVSGEVLGQVKTKDSSSPEKAAFGANPQDVYYLGDRAWVSRHTPNETVDDDDADRGLDLIEIDPQAFERTGERISFWDLNRDAQRSNDEGMTQTVTAYARPASIVPIGDGEDTVVVGIASLSDMFDAAGPGLVALVDLADGEVSELELPDLQNCGNVAPVPGDDDRVVVGCLGFYRGVQRDTAGLAVLHYDGDALAIEHTWHAKDHPDAAMAVANLISLGGTEVIAVLQAGAEAEQDSAYLVDIESGAQTEVFQATGRYVVGSGAYNAEMGLLLMPDASTDGDGVPTAGLRRFERDEDGNFSELDVKPVHPVLPPRVVRAL